MTTVVIVGVTDTLGRAITKRYAEKKCQLILIESDTISKNAEESIINECISSGATKAAFFKGNLTKEEDWGKILHSIGQVVDKIDIFFYLNSLTCSQNFKDIPNCAIVTQLIETNLFGPVFCLKSAVSLFRKYRTHVIIAVDGISKKSAKSCLYRSSKQGLLTLISTLQNEEKNITFAVFFPPKESNIQQNIDAIIDSVAKKEPRIANSKYRKTKVLKKSNAVIVDIEMRDPGPLKPNTANALSKALFNNNKAEIKEILKGSKNLSILEEKDEDGRTALHYACFIGHLDTLNLIISKCKKKNLINEPDNLKFSALHLACYRGHLKIARKLMQNAADPNILGCGNMSALHYLARLDPVEHSKNHNNNCVKVSQQFEQTLKYLIDAGADANQRNADWITPVHEACKSGSHPAVEFLLKHEGDVHRKTKTNGDTALHYAVLCGNQTIIKLLLERGADPSAVSINGTCFDIAPPDTLEILEVYREKNRRQDSDTVQVREVVVADRVEDLPPDALKMVQNAGLMPDSFPKLYDYWPILLHSLRFLTKRTYLRSERLTRTKGETAHVPTITIGSRAKLGINLEQAAERFISNGNPRKLFKFIEDAGKGGFGSVFKARRVDDKKFVAVKKIPHLSEKEQWNNYDEIHFLQTCEHENVVKYYNAFISRDEVWLVMEFMEGGSLSEVVNRKLEEFHIGYITKHILKGLKFMHSKNVVHRDLKSANVMLSISAAIKLIDFGLCADSSTPLESMVGSPFWIPPEMIQKKAHGCPADIWSLGILCIEMATGKPPHRNSSLKALFEIGIGNVPKLDEDKWSKPFLNFLDRMLVINPDDRATASELLRDPFIKSLHKNAVNEMRDVLRSIFLQKSLELSLGVGI